METVDSALATARILQFVSAPQNILLILYILPISGAEVVLGMQWLKTLEPIIIDYASLTMNFNWLVTNIHLKGIETLILKKSLQVN